MPPLTRDQSEEIKTIVNVAIKQMWMDQDIIKTIVDKVSSEISKNINKKLQIYERKIEDLKGELNQIKSEHNITKDELNSKINNLQSENEKLIKRCEYTEQESKRNNIRIFNMKEKNNENTTQEVINLLNSKLPININNNDIEICHRIGRTIDNKIRGIFIKFSNYQTRQEIYLNKKLLKGSGVIIREDLTSNRINLLNEAIRKTSLRDAWTNRGIVHVKINNIIKTIYSISDLETLD